MAGSSTTPKTLREEKNIQEGRKYVCKPVQTCRSQPLTPKRKLHNTLDVESPQKKIKISKNFTSCLNFWRYKENIHTHSGPAVLTVSSSTGENAKLSPEQNSSYPDFQSRGASDCTTDRDTDLE